LKNSIFRRTFGEFVLSRRGFPVFGRNAWKIAEAFVSQSAARRPLTKIAAAARVAAHLLLDRAAR
jgi:hypothetical protein